MRMSTSETVRVARPETWPSAAAQRAGGVRGCGRAAGDDPVRLALVACLLCGLIGLAAAMLGYQRAAVTQLWSVLALTIPCVAVMLAGGIGVVTSLAVWMTLGIGCLSTTMAVRSVIAAQKCRPRRSHLLGLAGLTVALAALGAVTSRRVEYGCGHGRDGWVCGRRVFLIHERVGTTPDRSLAVTATIPRLKGSPCDGASVRRCRCSQSRQPCSVSPVSWEPSPPVDRTSC